MVHTWPVIPYVPEAKDLKLVKACFGWKAGRYTWRNAADQIERKAALSSGKKHQLNSACPVYS